MSIIFVGEQGQDSNESQCQEILSQISGGEELSYSQYKEALERCYYLLSLPASSASYNTGLGIICYLAEAQMDDPLLKMLLQDCISASGNYPYQQMLDRTSDDYGSDEVSADIIEIYRKSYYTTFSGIVLTKDQKQVLTLFGKARRLVVSAPTSFGKSKLIEEILIANSFHRVAIVLPTIALLSETLRRLKSNEGLARYQILNNVSPPPETGRFIYLLTPERIDLILEANPQLRFDFFVMDEIYKIQDDQGRREIFTSVLYRLAKMAPSFYLIGPYFRRFSRRFLERFEATFQRFYSELVQKETIDLSQVPVRETVYIGSMPFTKAATEATNLKRLAPLLKEQTLFYASKRGRCESIAKKLADEWSPPKYPKDLVEYVEEIISTTWSMVACLKKGIGFHHGSIPRFLQTELIDAFNRGDIQALVCTTTITEGVNTTAKNVVILDSQKGDEPLTGFDVKNIKGRAGRFLEHFVGRVVTFHSLPEAEHGNIDFRFLDTDDLTSEEVLQIDEADLTVSNREHLASIRSTLADNRIPEALVRKNRYVAAHRQIALVEYLRASGTLMSSLLFAHNLPNKEQLTSIIELCFTYLFNRRDNEHQVFTIGMLGRLINYYVYRNPNLKQLIKEQPGVREDTRIRNTFYFISHYLEFALPTYLNTFEQLFNFVADEHGIDKIDVGFLVIKLEFGFLKPHEIALKDAGLPDDLINKVSNLLGEARTISEIRNIVRMNPRILRALSPFEQQVFRKYI